MPDKATKNENNSNENELQMMKATLLFLSGLLLIFTASSCDSEARKEKKLMEFFNQGSEYYDKEDYQKAYNCFDECIKIDSTYVEFYANRGNMSALMNDMERAKKDYEKALSMDTCSKSSLQGLAEYYEGHNDHHTAIFYWERLIGCHSTYPFFYINYGISCYEAEDYSKALSLFFECLKYMKDDPVPYEYIGKIFNQKGDSITANKFLEDAERITQKYGWDSVKNIIVIHK